MMVPFDGMTMKPCGTNALISSANDTSANASR